MKQAPFYVLGGAAMPAVLVEIGFLSNPQEEERLQDEGYRDRVARALAAGIGVITTPVGDRSILDALPHAAQERRDAVLGGGRADDPGVSHLDENRALGVPDVVPRDADGPEVVGPAAVPPGHRAATAPLFWS